MCGDKHLIRYFTRNKNFAVRQMSWFKRSVDHHLIRSLLQRLELIIGQTEAPIFFEVTRTIRYPVGVLRKIVQMALQLFKIKLRVDGYTIADHVEVGILYVDDRVPFGILDIRFANIPFPRHLPVEHLSAGRHLVNLQGYVLAYGIEC